MNPPSCRMAQQYYEYVNYREEHVQEQKKLPKGACHRYIIVFQSVFSSIFNVSLRPAFVHAAFFLLCGVEQLQRHLVMSFYLLSLPPQLSFVFAEFPMRFVLNGHLNTNKHILHSVKTCGKDARRPAFIHSPLRLGKGGACVIDAGQDDSFLHFSSTMFSLFHCACSILFFSHKLQEAK